MSEMAIKLEGIARDTYADMRKNGTYHYVIFKLAADGNEHLVTLETCAEGRELTSSEKFDEFVEALPEMECRFGVFDFRHMSEDEALVNNLLMFIWCPDEASRKEKDYYHARHGALRRELPGLKRESLVSHPDDFNYNEILQSLCAQ